MEESSHWLSSIGASDDKSDRQDQHVGNGTLCLAWQLFTSAQHHQTSKSFALTHDHLFLHTNKQPLDNMVALKLSALALLAFRTITAFAQADVSTNASW